MPPQFKSIMKIEQMIYSVKLGKSEKERGQPHTVSVSVHLGFKSELKAEETDQIEDTICYSKVSKRIAELFVEREYKMIEHLGKVIYKKLKSELPLDAQIRVCAHKLRPPVHCIQGGVQYICGDWT